MEHWPHVAVVILSWNGREYLSRLLPKTLSTNYENCQVYVIDNGSRDGSVQFVKDNFSSIELIAHEKNYGFAEGYNKGLKEIEADYYVLLNQDVVVPEDWITPVIHRMEKDPSVGVAQPKLRAYEHPESFEYAGAAGGFIDRWGYTFCRGRIFGDLEEDTGQYEDSSEIFWATGACFFIRASLYHRSGGLDNDFFAHMEEIDLCWRLKRAGFKIAYVPESTVHHIGGGSLPQEAPFKTYLNFRNNLIMLIKNLPLRQWYILFGRLLLDHFAFLYECLQGRFNHSMAIMKAHYQFLFYLFKWYNKRDNNPYPSLYHLTGVFQRSIIVQYFIKKVKYFQQLKRDDFT